MTIDALMREIETVQDRMADGIWSFVKRGFRGRNPRFKIKGEASFSTICANLPVSTEEERALKKQFMNTDALFESIVLIRFDDGETVKWAKLIAPSYVINTRLNNEAVDTNHRKMELLKKCGHALGTKEFEDAWNEEATEHKLKMICEFLKKPETSVEDQAKLVYYFLYRMLRLSNNFDTNHPRFRASRGVFSVRISSKPSGIEYTGLTFGAGDCLGMNGYAPDPVGIESVLVDLQRQFPGAVIGVKLVPMSGYEFYFLAKDSEWYKTLIDSWVEAAKRRGWSDSQITNMRLRVTLRGLDTTILLPTLDGAAEEIGNRIRVKWQKLRNEVLL